MNCNNCKHIECIDRYKEVSQYCEGEKKDYRTPEEWEKLTVEGLERAYADMRSEE